MLRLIGVLLLAGVAAADPRPAPAPFLVIVHPSNSVSALTRAELSAIYLKRMRSWAGGAAIVAVDQTATSVVRARFTSAVHGKSVAFVTRYWHRLLFSGRAVPPPVLPSDAAVIELVRSEPGAIGYIAATAAPEGVKVIVVQP